MEFSGGLDGPACISATIRYPREVRFQVCVTNVGTRVYLLKTIQSTHLNATENPQNERLHDYQSGRPDSEGKIDADILAHLWVTSKLGVNFRPMLEPDTAS